MDDADPGRRYYQTSRSRSHGLAKLPGNGIWRLTACGLLTALLSGSVAVGGSWIAWGQHVGVSEAELDAGLSAVRVERVAAILAIDSRLNKFRDGLQAVQTETTRNSTMLEMLVRHQGLTVPTRGKP